MNKEIGLLSPRVWANFTPFSFTSLPTTRESLKQPQPLVVITYYVFALTQLFISLMHYHMRATIKSINRVF
ncbi:uncharacterized protein YALI1_D18392g [Yarrowia lipolytica]|uniref:Uncharacterized protein n=1 Tax=Yarrowia lipolytica TaxID=4952 RepID=A0A1D8NEQ2_YARLL|nr:hypothetical protein YALI1_D18392g [Yarrowia lipolytica]